MQLTKRNIGLWRMLLLACVLLCCNATKGWSQQLPPRPFAIYTNPTQGLMFGAFCQGALGGTLILFADGTRSSTGDVIPLGLGFPFSPAIIEVEAPVGSRIAILNGADANLTGTNGGNLVLQIGNADVGSNFITSVAPPGRTQVRVGGTLIIGTPLANPAGYYSGLFTVTFVQE